jgi:hypothetical protein
MKVDLGPLPYKMAFDMIHWCFDHNIDRENCIKLIEASSERPCPTIKWELDIPEKYVTMFILKWL